MIQKSVKVNNVLIKILEYNYLINQTTHTDQILESCVVVGHQVIDYDLPFRHRIIFQH